VSGSMDSAAALLGQADGALDPLEEIAAGRPTFGNPANFVDHIEQIQVDVVYDHKSRPHVLPTDPGLDRHVPGEGGLITFPESSWLASIVLPHQPHFMLSQREFRFSGAMDCSLIYRAIS